MTRKRNAQPETKVATLVVTLAEAKQRVQAQLDLAQALVTREIADQDALRKAKTERNTWYDFTKELLRRICDSDQLAREFDRVTSMALLERLALHYEVELFRSDLQGDMDRLYGIHQRLELFASPASKPRQEPRSTPTDLEMLMQRFHLVVRQLRIRHGNRPTLDVNDEYDVQDLLCALLRIYYDDIRDEEWTPSYAGGSSRVDFLLKGEQTVIEVKKARKGLRDKEIGDELLIDIGRYRAHPDCSSLFCFVYDPDGHIVNPNGLERDLSKEINGMLVKVLVVPKGQ